MTESINITSWEVRANRLEKWEQACREMSRRAIKNGWWKMAEILADNAIKYEHQKLAVRDEYPVGLEVYYSSGSHVCEVTFAIEHFTDESFCRDHGISPLDSESIY